MKTVYFHHGSRPCLARVRIGSKAEVLNDFPGAKIEDSTGVIWSGHKKIVCEREFATINDGMVHRYDVIYTMTHKDHSIDEIIDIFSAVDDSIWTKDINEIKKLLLGVLPWSTGWGKHKAWVSLYDDALGYDSLPPIPMSLRWSNMKK